MVPASWSGRRIAALAAIVALLVLAFALGRWSAGGLPDGATGPGNRAAEQRIARLETDARIDREAYARVEAQLAELQEKLLEQQEEVAFYRGIVGGPGEGGLKVQDFALDAADEGAVRMHFVLAQAESGAREVSGQVQIRVEGARDGRIVSADVASLAAGRKAPLGFRFRYFQEMAVELRPPAGFEPQRVVVRIVPAAGAARGSVESFPWRVSGG